MLHRRIDNKEAKEFWDFVAETSRRAKTLPEWKQKELQTTREAKSGREDPRRSRDGYKESGKHTERQE